MASKTYAVAPIDMGQGGNKQINRIADAILSDDVPAFHQITDVSAAQFLTLATSSSLPNERVFAPGAGIIGTDGGAGSTYTIDVVAADGTITVNANSIQVGTINTANINDSQITNAKLRDSIATSVIGRSANSTGVVADIAASADLQFLRRSGGVLGFAAITSGDLPALGLDATFLTLSTNSTLANERVFTPTSGLTAVDGGAGAAYTLTNDVLTGKATGQTWTGGTTPSDPLVVRSSSNATKGPMTLQASQVLVENAETAHPSAMFVLNNTSATGQMTIWLKADGTLRGGLRSDYAGNLTWFARGGIHQFYTGGDAGEGTLRLQISTGGVVTIADLSGGTAEMVKVSTTGALQRAQAGVDYVFPGTVAPIDATYLTLSTNATLTQERTFTPSSGLSVVDGGASSTYTITNDVLTGKTSGQTFYGGVNASGTLAIHSTVSGTKGAITLAASQFLLSNAETGFPAATLVLDNTSATGQMAIWAKSAGVLYGGLRVDYGGNHHSFAKGGVYNIWTGGDADTGTIRIQVAAAGTVTIADLSGGSATLVKTSTTGLLSRATVGVDYLAPGTVAPIDAQYLTLATNATLTVERVFTPSSGLTAVDSGAGAAYTLTNDVLTGKSGDQTWTGGTASGDDLTIRSTSNATRGLITLDAVDVRILNGQTDYTIPTFYLDNSNASGQAAFHFKTGAGTLRAGLRGDFAGHLSHFATGTGGHNFYVGGDNATNAMVIASTGTITIANLGGGGTALVRASTVGLLTRTTVATADIDNDAVTFAKIENVTADKLLGRGNGGGTGDTQEITLGTNLSMSGTTLNAATGGVPTSRVLTAGNGLTGGGDLTADRTFDVAAADATISVTTNAIAVGTINTANINNDQVTFAKIQNITASRLLGRDSSGGDVQEITLGTDLSLSGTTLNVTAFAPSGAQYLTLATSSGLSAERVLTMSTGFVVSDGGAGGNYTVTNGVYSGVTGSPIWQGSSDGNNLTIRANTSATGTMSLTSNIIAMTIAGVQIADGGDRDYVDIVMTNTNVTSAANNAAAIYSTVKITPTTYTAVSGSPTCDAIVSLYIPNAPISSGLANGQRLAIWVDEGLCRFDGDSGLVFQVPNFGHTASDTNTYAIPVHITGVGTRYIRLHDVGT